MGISLFLAFLFACYQLYYVYNKQYLLHWEMMWVLEVGFWQVLYSIVFFAIMFLWRPVKNFKDYAFMQELETKDEIDEEVTLRGCFVVRQSFSFQFEDEFGPDGPDQIEMEARFTIDELI